MNEREAEFQEKVKQFDLEREQHTKERLAVTEQNAHIIKSANDLREEINNFENVKKEFSTFKKISMNQVSEVEKELQTKKQKLEKEKESLVVEKVLDKI